MQGGSGLAFPYGFAAAAESKAWTPVAVSVPGLGVRRELKFVYRRDMHPSRGARPHIVAAGDEAPERPSPRL